MAALVFVACILALVTNAFLGAREDAEATDTVRRSDSAAANAFFTQRESLVLANRVERWLQGDSPRRDVQIQRALLQRRLDVLDPTGTTAQLTAGEQYDRSLDELDAALVSLPAGLLDEADRATRAAALRAPLDAFEEASTRLGAVYQSATDERVDETLRSRSEGQQRTVLLLIGAAVSGLALALVTSQQIRWRYREARVRIMADRAALERASVLERGEAEILAGIVDGRPIAELVGEVLDLAHDLTGRCLRFVRGVGVLAEDLPEVTTHSAGALCTDGRSFTIVGSWPVRAAGGESFGDLEMCAEDDAAPTGPTATGSSSTASFGEAAEAVAAEAVARRCSDLVALVLDRAIAAEQLHYRATHDPLTSLPNRALLLDRIAEALTSHGPDSAEVAVVFCDLDRFKLVNDTLGHRSGDRLLRAVSRRLSSVAVGNDVSVARLGGDEFVALCVGAGAAARAAAVADAMAVSLDGPFLIDGSEVFVSGSLGVAVSGPSVRDAEQLLRNSDVAMYRAKADPNVRVVAYNEDLEADVAERLLTDSALRRALANDELVVHLQPIVELSTGRACGVEALVRWQRDDTLVYPGAFLQLAQDNGLMPELGRIVIGRALDALVDHRAAGLEELTMWINLARVQLRDPDFPAWLLQQLERRGLPASALVLELSEGDLLDAAEVGEVLAGLRAVGMRIAMDDFGTGYSSLVRLGKLPIDVVKLDRAFVSSLGTGDFRDYSVLAAAVKFVGAVGLDVVVEGIERQVELDAVVSLGCRYAQGFLLRRPAPADEILGELAEGRTAVVALGAPSAPVGG
ncbi:MAG: putative bifunctional diguanylate cyclase/phosphodiesterase [Microthrixaceae bacterium]